MPVLASYRSARAPFGQHSGCAATRSAACATKEVTAVIAALALVGCASKSADVAPAYVSPLQCEAQRVAAAAATAAGQQDSQATKDAVATTVGVLIVWPALFLIQGDKQNVAQLAQLKGEMDAIGTRVHSEELRNSVPTSARSVFLRGSKVI